MRQTIFIVEKDPALLQSIRSGLEGVGFTAIATTDAKNCVEQISKKKPAVVVLGVDLEGGQNGYLICKRLKSEPDFEGLKVVIIGDPRGFASHQKLRTHADEYLGKPLQAAKVVETVQKMVPSEKLVPADESADAESMEFGVELSVEGETDKTESLDEDFTFVDDALDAPPRPPDTSSPELGILDDLDLEPISKPPPTKPPARAPTIKPTPRPPGSGVSHLKLSTRLPSAVRDSKLIELTPARPSSPSVHARRDRDDSGEGNAMQQVGDLKAQLAEALGELEASKLQVEALEQDLAEARAQNETSQAELERLNTRTTELARKLAERESDVKNLERSAAAKQGSARGSQEALERMRGQLASAMQSLTEAIGTKKP